MSTVYTAPRHTAAQEALIAAYIRLHGVMPRHRIKVMDICREAPAARSTFYLYCDSVDMLKDDIENAGCTRSSATRMRLSMCLSRLI